MITPNYGPFKQIQYRLMIMAFIQQHFKNKPIVSVSLGGAHCLENPDSIESFILAKNAGGLLCIPEYDAESCEYLVKSLKRLTTRKIKVEKRGRGFAYIGKIGKTTVEIYHGKLYNYLKWSESVRREHHVFISDYYCTLNRNVMKDLDIIRRGRIRAKGACIFLTSCKPTRAINTPICQKIIKRDTNKENPSYEGGMKVWLNSFFNSKDSQINDRILSWNYNNTDIAPMSLDMIVAKIPLV